MSNGYSPGPAAAAGRGTQATADRPAGSERVPRLKDVGQAAIAHVSLAKSLFQRGRQEQALAELDAALRENPEMPQAHFVKGLILAYRADFAAAAEHLEYAVRLGLDEEDEAKAWLGLAYVRQELGALDQALAAVDRGIRLDEQDSNAHLCRGNILAIMKRRVEAIASYRLAIKFNPQLTMARYKLGHLLAEAGATEEAIQQLMVTLRLSPTNPNTRMSLGNIFRELGRLDEAFEEYKAAAELSGFAPQQALACEKLGEVYLELGQVAGAIEMFRTAIRLNAKQIFCHLHLGRIYMAQRRYGEAVETLRAVIEVDPRLPEAIALLEEAEGLTGRQTAGHGSRPSGEGDHHCKGDGPRAMEGMPDAHAAAGRQRVGAVMTDPADFRTSLLVHGRLGSGHVCRTTDGGISWAGISLPSIPARDVAPGPRLAVATSSFEVDVGVDDREDRGLIRSRLGAGLSGISVAGPEISPSGYSPAKERVQVIDLFVPNPLETCIVMHTGADPDALGRDP